MSDAGLLLAREVGLRMGPFERIADCFTDHRDQRYVTHSVGDLVAQRILALVAGYEDLNDHDLLRLDPLFAAAVGKAEAPAPLASPSTLNRLEHGKDEAATDRYRRLLTRMSELADLLLALALDRHSSPPEHIVLEVDATDDRIHGTQARSGPAPGARDRCRLSLPALGALSGRHVLG